MNITLNKKELHDLLESYKISNSHKFTQKDDLIFKENELKDKIKETKKLSE